MRFTNLITDETALAEMGERIARLRLERGLTQAELATAAAVSKSTVERLEGGASSQLSNFLRCLRALGRLENLELLLPEIPPSPIDLLERHGKVRQRARSSAEDGPAATWAWGKTQ
jgi:transcriptional regulator with XRE-family HTH domain